MSWCACARVCIRACVSKPGIVMGTPRSGRQEQLDRISSGRFVAKQHIFTAAFQTAGLEMRLWVKRAIISAPYRK